MDISLYYIKGISPLDEPNFLNKSSQEEFFNSKKIINIDTTYYPPHYTNSIRFDVNDLDFNTKVNYLSLNYDNKIYYYFIQNIRYINEYVFECDIIMDTIQTYMFDIIYNNFSINRYSMKRWKKLSKDRYVINRDYERENLSLTDKDVVSYTEYESNNFIIVKARKLQDNTLNKPSKLLIDNYSTSKKIDISDGCEYYIIPFPNDTSFDTIWKVNFVTTYGEINYSYNKSINEILSYLTENEYIIDIYYSNNDAIYKNFPYTVDYSSNTIDITNLQGNRYEIFNINDFNMLYIKELTILYKNDILLDFSFTRNTSINALFTKNFVPQLLDENYYSLQYGEKLGYTSLPLHKLLNSTIIAQNFYNITNGNRIFKLLTPKDYNIEADKSYEFDDKYLSGITNSTIETLPTYSNAYQRYLSTNKGTLTTGLALAKQENLFDFTTSSINSLGKLAGNIASGNYGNIISTASGTITSGLNYSFTDYKIDKQYQIQKENYEFTPDTTKSGNEYTSDIIGNNISTIKILSQVNDLDSVAMKMEMYGYKFNIIKSNNSEDYNLLQDLELLPRYYYNIIACDNMNLSFKVLVPNNLKEDIINRFNSGIRFWNCHSNIVAGYIGNFSYDNIEYENIGE